MSAASSRDGLPVYRVWRQVPEEYLTMTQIKRGHRRLRPGARAIAVYLSPEGDELPLYLAGETVVVSRKLAGRNWPSIFAERYTTKESAHLDVARALFEMNRYSKHQACPQPMRHKLYILKERVLRLFWDAGYCTRAQLAYAPALERTCRECGGQDSAHCCRCKGTGLYLTGGAAYWSLSFTIEGKAFHWHQPARMVNWIEVTGDGRSLDPEEVVKETKPVTLSRKKHAEALALLEWVISPE